VRNAVFELILRRPKLRNNRH